MHAALQESGEASIGTIIMKWSFGKLSDDVRVCCILNAECIMHFMFK